MRALRIILFSALLTLTFMAVTPAHQALAGNCGEPSRGLSGGTDCGTSPINIYTGVTRAINTLLYIVGISAVIVIIVAGLRYVLSGGDPKNTTAAKDTILYAVIGLVVALLSFAIVNFVVVRFQ